MALRSAATSEVLYRGVPTRTWREVPLPTSLEVRKLLDRAKGLLQSEHGLTEPEAFRWIQKTSMDRRLTMRKVAEAVIEGSMRVPAETPQPQP